MKEFQVKLKYFLEVFKDTFQLHRTGVGICKGNYARLEFGLYLIFIYNGRPVLDWSWFPSVHQY